LRFAVNGIGLCTIGGRAGSAGVDEVDLLDMVDTPVR
jgi:hypothetical protein